MSSTKMPDSLREMWETRPSRPKDGRMVAGVSAAIANRYDVDPLLIRIGFAVSAFYGVGIALYVAGWLLLPAADGEGRSRPPKPFAVMGLIALGVVVTGSLFGGGSDWFVPTAATLGLLYLLHRSRSGQGVLPRYRPPAGRDGTAAESGAERVDLTKGTPAGAAPAEEAPPQPPAWDPLGAAPFAWDLPEPAAPQPPPPPGRRPVTAVTLALVLLAVGTTIGVLLAVDAFTPASIGVVAAVALAVVGAGLVVGAFLHTGRGLIPIAVLLGALTWAAAAMPLEDWPEAASGSVELAPTTPAAVPANTSVGAGYVEYDLTGLDLSVPEGAPAEPVAVSLDIGAGYAEIRVPRDADVTFHGRSGFGYLEFEGAERGGTDAVLDVVDDLGTDGERSGRPIVIEADTHFGYVEVSRG